jgi:hypothetical protein
VEQARFASVLVKIRTLFAAVTARVPLHAGDRDREHSTESTFRMLKCVDDQEDCAMYSEVVLRYIDRVKILFAQSRTFTDPIKADLADEQRAVRTSVPHHPTLLSTGCALELLLRLLLCAELRM